MDQDADNAEDGNDRWKPKSMHGTEPLLSPRGGHRVQTKEGGKRMKGRDWAQVASGAALATAAVVALYEGKAYLGQSEASPRREAAAADSRASNPPMPDRPIGRAELPLMGSVEVTESSAAAQAAKAARVASQLDHVNGKLAEVQREKEDLEAQLRSLENALVNRPPSSPAGEAHEFELDRDDWKELATQARIKYRIPCTLPAHSSYAIPQEELDELGLSPDDGKTLVEAHRRSNARVWATLRPLCAKAVGDDTVVDLLDRSDCLGVLERAATKSDVGAGAAARRLVGEVHAGMRTPPEPGQSTPLFDALMALTREAQYFEADVAESFGPEDAKRIVQSMRCADTTR